MALREMMGGIVCGLTLCPGEIGTSVLLGLARTEMLEQRFLRVTHVTHLTSRPMTDERATHIFLLATDKRYRRLAPLVIEWSRPAARAEV